MNLSQKKEPKKTPIELLEEMNLIGCIEAEEDFSQNYKKTLSQSLGKNITKESKE